MLIRPRVAVTSLLVAIPTAVVVSMAVDRLRMRDLEQATYRVVQSQINDQVRERCESDPTWFLTGPLAGRPPGGIFVAEGPDDLPPRPRVEPQPFELFAYDIELIGSSSATPRLPEEIRRALRSRPEPIVLPYVKPAGTGVQVAMATGWTGSTCMYFLGRMAPPEHQTRTRVLTLFGVYAALVLTALAGAFPTVTRIRRLARAAHESVDQDFRAIAPDRRQDELGSLTFVFNDSAQTLHERKARIAELNESLRRLVKRTDEDIARPLAELSLQLGSVAAAPSADGARAALVAAHTLAGHVSNLIAAAELRSMGAASPRGTVDLVATVSRVVGSHVPFARARGVAIDIEQPDSPVTIAAQPALVERIVANLLDNAVRYNRPGGTVRVVLRVVPDESRFVLWVTDDGPGVSDAQFKGLTAIRRFRGDEHQNRRPDAPGLGLAVTREACDRFGLDFSLRRPPEGGLEAEVSGAVHLHP
jgi:signal transduction histidine kinase